MELFIGGLLLSFPLALIGVILLFTVLYSESRMAARIGKRFGFQVSGKRLSKPGWQLGFHHQTEGRKTRYLMGYEVQLEGLPKKFQLVQRGASSALLSRHGLESEKSGDEDFDGLFHHQGVLKPGQRGLLLDLWQLLPDFGISQGHLSGQVVYEQSPQGLARLSQIVEKLHSFQKEFPAATTHLRSLPVGFVRNQKLSQESTFCWLGATIAGTPALGYASYCGIAGLSIYDLGTLACLLLLATALSFVNCALQVTRGSYAAVEALEWTRKLTLCAGLVVVPLVVRSAASPIGASVVGVMMVVMAHLSLSQLKDKWEGILDRS